MIEKFKIITDKRHQNYIKHKLFYILIIVMCAILCGLDERGDIVTFPENKANFFNLKTNAQK